MFNQPSPMSPEELAALIDADKEGEQLQQATEYEAARIVARRRGEALAAEKETSLRKVGATTAESFMPRRVRWLWAPGEAGEGRIPMGELTLIVGRGGVGKSTLLAQMAAWITRGDMQGEFYGQPRDVLYVANEDSLNYTVVPRLMAAGADLARVHFLSVTQTGIGESAVLLPTDCDAVGEAAARTGAVAVMLDPLSSNLKVENGNDGKKVRSVIEDIRRMCERYGVATIGLAHTRKAQSTNLMDALMGSAELGNVCRSAMGVIADPEEEGTIILSQEKSNLGKVGIDSYKYRIESYSFQFDGETITTGMVNFLGKTDQTASSILADAAGGTTGTTEVTEWLRGFLETEGPTERKEIVKAARNEGYNESAVQRAKQRLKIKSVSMGSFPKVVRWSLP